MNEQIAKKFEEIKKENPHLPDGRVDYSNADEAMAINVFVQHEGKTLLLKRSKNVKYYKGKWNSSSGFYDEPVAIREKALKELAEETGIAETDITSFNIGEPFTFRDTGRGISWFIIPVLVELSHTPNITLDAEHEEMRWVNPSELSSFDTIPHLSELYRHAAA